MIVRAGLASMLAACAPAPVPRAQPVFVPPACVEVSATKTPVVPPAHESACFRKGRPKTLVLEKVEDSVFCHDIDAAELARVEARVRKDLVVQRKPSKLVVDFACDALGSDIAEVVVEDGSGHGGSLRIVRFARGQANVDVRMITRSQYFNAGNATSIAQMPTADFDAIVRQARVAVLARPHLIPLWVPSSTIHLGGFGSSSNDFHLGLALTDAEGHVVDRHFSGYDSSLDQQAILTMRMATERFETAIASLAFTPQTSPTDADKEIFVRRFLAAMKDGEKPFWWVTERYVALAVDLGTIDIVPTLAKIAQQKGEASADRTRPVALDAITAITGWDPRKDDRGQPRTLDDATAIAAQECTTPTLH